MSYSSHHMESELLRYPQALDFVYSQRETFSALLSDNMPQVSLSALKELHLLVALSAFVLPQVKDEPLVSLFPTSPR
jgi:hypothetical protein